MPPSRIGRRTCRTATATRRGSTPGPWSWPGSTARRPTRRTAGSSATRTARRRARSTRARPRSSNGCSRRRPTRARRGLRIGPGVSPLARDHRLAGRDRRAARRRDVSPRAAAAGWLTGRVEGALWWDRERGARAGRRADRAVAARPGGRFRPNSVKLMTDGVLENVHRRDARAVPRRRRAPDRQSRASASSTPRCSTRPSPARRRRASSPTSTRSATGPSGSALDAVAAARAANGPSDTRPHIAHIQVIHPDDIPRFAALGVAANAQPLWACHEPQMDELTIPFLGPERTTWQYPFASLLRAGAPLAMGSDWSVSTAEPARSRWRSP